MSDETVTVRYTDGTEAPLTLPAEQWAPAGSERFIQQVAGDDGEAQDLIRGMQSFFRQRNWGIDAS